MTSVLIKNGRLGRGDREHHVNRKAEITVTHLQAKGHQERPANQQKLKRRHRTVSLTLSEGTSPANSLISDESSVLASRTVRE